MTKSVLGTLECRSFRDLQVCVGSEDGPHQSLSPEVLTLLWQVRRLGLTLPSSVIVPGFSSFFEVLKHHQGGHVW